MHVLYIVLYIRFTQMTKILYILMKHMDGQMDIGRSLKGFWV